MTDKLQKIRKEVERLMNELIQEKEKGYGSDADDACILELQNVLTFIDSMQEEPVSEDLEKAARKYAGIPEDSPHDLKYCVQDKKAKYDAVLYGANWQKEQIIKRLYNHANIDQMVEKFENKYKPEKVFDTEYYKREIFDTIKAIKED